jgi:uncharacterized protein (TIGR00369 family)
MTKILERLQRALRGEDPGPGHPEVPAPISRLLGIQLVGADEGTAELEMHVTALHHNAMGALHGGVLCDLGDCAMGTALQTLFEEGERFVTVELKVSFVRPVREGRLRARGRVVHRGKTVSLVECDIVRDDERLVARLSCTCLAVGG